MKTKKVLSDIIVLVYVCLLLIYILMGSISIKYNMYKIFDLSVGLISFAVIGICVYVINKIINKKKFDKYDVLIYLLVFFGIIATAKAVRPEVSLYGFAERCEGLLQLILYYVLFLNCKNIGNKKFKFIIVWLIVGICVVQSIYGILQFFDIKNFLRWEILRIRYYSTGFEVNPNFFGSLMIIGLGLSLLIYFIKFDSVTVIGSLFISVVLFLGLLCSGAMSGAVAFIAQLMGIIFLLLILKLDRFLSLVKCLMIFVCFTTSYYLFNSYDEGYYLSQLEKTKIEMSESLKGDFKPIYGSGRIHIWKETIKIIPDNIWNGVGIDNFCYAFGGERPLIDVKSGFLVDKAHNEYLQKLITEGVFSFVIYLILLFLLFFKSIIIIIKKRNNVDCLFVALFMSFCGYCIQAFFNISVISVAPIFYIVMGLLCSLMEDDQSESFKCERDSKYSIGDFKKGY